MLFSEISVIVSLIHITGFQTILMQILQKNHSELKTIFLKLYIGTPRIRFSFLSVKIFEFLVQFFGWGHSTCCPVHILQNEVPNPFLGGECWLFLHHLRANLRIVRNLCTTKCGDILRYIFLLCEAKNSH